jgi:choline kinase
MMERQLGRESQKDNDLFYTCSLIDYIARKTKNKRVAVVDALGKENEEQVIAATKEKVLAICKRLPVYA